MASLEYICQEGDLCETDLPMQGLDKTRFTYAFQPNLMLDLLPSAILNSTINLGWKREAMADTSDRHFHQRFYNLTRLSIYITLAILGWCIATIYISKEC